LCKLYEEAAEFFKQLEDEVIMQTLRESLGDFKTTLEENLKNIKPRDQYVVLVAGKQLSIVTLFTEEFFSSFLQASIGNMCVIGIKQSLFNAVSKDRGWLVVIRTNFRFRL